MKQQEMYGENQELEAAADAFLAQADAEAEEPSHPEETVKTDPEEITRLLAAYHETGDTEIRNQIVMHYSYVAKACAIQLRGVYQNYAQLEDIVNHGIITLIDCVDRYDAEKGKRFESYAYMRVRGAIISLVRQQDWIPRRVRMLSKKVQQAHDALCNRLMREPTREELCTELDMTEEALEKADLEIANVSMLSFEGLIQNTNQMGDLLEDFSDENSKVDNNIYQKELHKTLTEAIEQLSDRERLVITLFYYERMKIADIAEILGVSIQRVSQLSSRAVMKLRRRMEEYMKG